MNLSGAASFYSDGSPRPARLLFSALLLLIFSLLHLHAQTNTPTDDEVIRVETNLVTVPVVITDHRQRRVFGLAATDFDVRDEGRSVELAHFAEGTERVALLFLLDASGSTRDIIAQQGEAALALFSRFGKRSRIALMQFQEKPSLSLAFTKDYEGAREAFKFVSLPNRRTAIFDAALAAVRAFQTTGDSLFERRIIILVSDGLDTASTTKSLTVIKEAALKDVTFYVIHTPLFTPREGRLAPRSPTKGFRDLADKTGGRFFILGDAQTALSLKPRNDLQPIFQAIEDDLRGQYVLSFYASAIADSIGARRVEVRLKQQSGRKFRVKQLRNEYLQINHP